MKKHSMGLAEVSESTGVGITYVGLDVHKASISVAGLVPGAPDVVEWKQLNSSGAVRRLARKLKRLAPGEVVCCYEAGPCGYAVQRELLKLEVACQVIAPSLVPSKPGCRVKTDRRDARKLAELLRADLLTEVHTPTPEEEAVRDLCRCRDDARENQMRERHRLNKFVLRRGIRWTPGRSHWTQAHRKWLRSLRFEHEAERMTFEDYLAAVEQVEQRLKALDEAIAAIAQQEPYREMVGALCCFRGIKTVTAMTIIAELHDLGRFSSPRQLMSYLGLTPSEYSSSERTQRGSITKTGNKHVRRVLIEAAWHSRHTPHIGATLKKRREGQPPRVIAIADRAMRRLHKRYIHLVLGGNKLPAKAAVAVARELAGFIWATLTQLPTLTAPQPR